jgi:hypothetical protein
MYLMGMGASIGNRYALYAWRYAFFPVERHFDFKKGKTSRKSKIARTIPRTSRRTSPKEPSRVGIKVW